MAKDANFGSITSRAASNASLSERPLATLSLTEHRPWPLPSRQWLMAQTWERLLFAHWPVAAERMQDLVPGLQVDTFDGRAWLGVTPFVVTGLRIAASYACRGRNNDPNAQLSEHAYGNAIDISAFEVSGHGWIAVGHATGDDQKFLSAIRQSACGPFTTGGRGVQPPRRRPHRGARPGPVAALGRLGCDRHRSMCGSLDRWESASGGVARCARSPEARRRYGDRRRLSVANPKAEPHRSRPGPRRARGAPVGNRYIGRPAADVRGAEVLPRQRAVRRRLDHRSVRVVRLAEVLGVGPGRRTVRPRRQGDYYAMSSRISDSVGYAHLWGTEELRALFAEPARLAS